MTEPSEQFDLEGFDLVRGSHPGRDKGLIETFRDCLRLVQERQAISKDFQWLDLGAGAGSLAHELLLELGSGWHILDSTVPMGEATLSSETMCRANVSVPLCVQYIPLIV